MYISFFSDYTDRMIVWQPGNISRLSDGEKLIFLGKEETIATAYITFIYPLLVYFTEDLTYIIKPDNYLLAAFYAGVLSGIANGVIFKVGFNTGGVGVLSKNIFKYLKRTRAKLNAIINCNRLSTKQVKDSWTQNTTSSWQP